MDGCGNKIGPYDCCTIVTGDAKELAPAIPDESVDLIFTDPVYDRIEDYRWLAETAQRILKPRCSCIVQIGSPWLPQILAVMNGPLTFWWPLVERLDKGNARLWKHHIYQTYKLWLWFTNDSAHRSGGWVRDSARASGVSKRLHEWGDAIDFPIAYISRLVEDESSVVYDPFTGGGTVPAACKTLAGHYLAFEIDPEVAERARERVRNTQPPLFVMEPEQAEFAT